MIALTRVDVHLRRVSADNVATLRRTIERRRHHAINRVPCLAVLLRSEPDSAHPVIRGPVAGLRGKVVMPVRLTVGTHYAGQTSWWLNGHNHSVVAWAGRTFDSMTDATQAADDFKTRSATAWTNHDLDTAMSYIADDIVCDTPPDRLEGARAY